MVTIEKTVFGTKFIVVEPASIGFPKHTTGEFDDHEPVLERWISGIRSGDVVVDAGAQFGSYTMPALARGATVIAFEPMDDAQKILQANVDANGWSSSFCLKTTCLWDGSEYPEELSRQVFGHHYPASKLETSRLDDLGIGTMPGKLHIKLDIEGAEFGALNGARNILETYHPRLIIEDHEGVSPDPNDEISRYPERIHSRAKMRALLEPLGYKIEVVPWDVSRGYWVCE
jgi:FkbM family methyltransferase